MDSKKNNWIFGTMIRFTIVFALYSCNLKCSIEHSPIMPYFVYPDKEIYKIGDTIWLEARMPFVMKDFENGEYANYKHVDFKSYFYLAQYKDTSKPLNGQPKPYFAHSSFSTMPFTGTYYDNGASCNINYSIKNDTFYFKTAIIPKDTGFFSINLAYNPGGTAHGLQKIEMDENNCKNTISILCQSINNGNSTLYRAIERGYKPWYSYAPTKLEYRIYKNCFYYFQVEK